MALYRGAIYYTRKPGKVDGITVAHHLWRVGPNEEDQTDEEVTLYVVSNPVLKNEKDPMEGRKITLTTANAEGLGLQRANFLHPR